MIDTPSPKPHPKVARPNKESIPREGSLPVKEWVSEVDESLAKEHVKTLVSDRRLRIFLAITIVMVFAAWNGVVVYIVEIAAETDAQMIREKLIESAHRTITDKVYISLIAATAAQVGTLLVVMARYLFRAPTASRLRAKSRQDR